MNEKLLNKRKELNFLTRKVINEKKKQIETLKSLIHFFNVIDRRPKWINKMEEWQLEAVEKDLKAFDELFRSIAKELKASATL